MRVKHWARALAPAMLMALLVTGCKSKQKVEVYVPTNQAALESAADAVNRNNLDQAKKFQQQAVQLAASETERAKADDMGHLIGGAEALHVGDVETAQRAWSRIADPELGREVTEKARQIGIEVPVSTIETTQVAEAE